MRLLFLRLLCYLCCLFNVLAGINGASVGNARRNVGFPRFAKPVLNLQPRVVQGAKTVLTGQSQTVSKLANLFANAIEGTISLVRTLLTPPGNVTMVGGISGQNQVKNVSGRANLKRNIAPARKNLLNLGKKLYSTMDRVRSNIAFKPPRFAPRVEYSRTTISYQPPATTRKPALVIPIKEFNKPFVFSKYTGKFLKKSSKYFRKPPPPARSFGYRQLSTPTPVPRRLISRSRNAPIWPPLFITNFINNIRQWG